jgi:hypothetical protein
VPVRTIEFKKKLIEGLKHECVEDIQYTKSASSTTVNPDFYKWFAGVHEEYVESAIDLVINNIRNKFPNIEINELYDDSSEVSNKQVFISSLGNHGRKDFEEWKVYYSHDMNIVFRVQSCFYCINEDEEFFLNTFI